MKLLHFSHSLPLLLAASNCLSESYGISACLNVTVCCRMSFTVPLIAMELLHASYYLSWFAVSNCLFKFHVVAACLLLSPMVACCLSLSLPVPWSCWLSITVYLGPMELLHLSHFHPLLWDFSHGLYQCNEVAACLSLSLQCHGVAACLSQSPMVACSLRLSLPVPWSCCISLTASLCYLLLLTVSKSPMEFLHVWMSPTVVECLSSSLSVPCSCCMPL